jgi:hypothetical protein
MQIGDKINVHGVEYTIWLIEDNIYHIINEAGHGICGDLDFIVNLTNNQ